MRAIVLAIAVLFMAKKAPLGVVSSTSEPPVIGPTAIDCKMIKPIDPQFVSAMPVIPPDPNLQLLMPIVRVPPCKD